MSDLIRVYGWRNIHTDEWYIGRTSLPMKIRSKKDLSGYMSCRIFYKAIEEYGPNAFEENILGLYLTQEEADEAERRFIKEKNSLYPNGYNLETGGISGKEIHEETRKVQSENASCPWKGKHLSEDTKQKLSESHKGLKYPTLYKPVIQSTLSGEFVAEYKSGREASIQTGIPFQNISHVCRGKRLSAGGYQWRYAS